MLAGVIAKTVQIRDPYCLSSDENRRHLTAFIRELCGILAEPGQLTVTYRHDDSAGENAYRQEQAVKKLLLLLGSSVPVTFLPYRRRHYWDDFHDRLVNVIAVAPEAMAGEHSFELTGGIDRLMGETVQTRYFMSGATWRDQRPRGHNFCHQVYPPKQVEKARDNRGAPDRTHTLRRLLLRIPAIVIVQSGRS